MIDMTQSRIPLRTIAIFVAAAITIWMVFNEGTLTAVLVAGLFFFLGSLLEVYQRREMLDRRRLITFTAIYVGCIFVVILGLIWRYRELFLQ